MKIILIVFALIAALIGGMAFLSNTFPEEKEKHIQPTNLLPMNTKKEQVKTDTNLDKAIDELVGGSINVIESLTYIEKKLEINGTQNNVLLLSFDIKNNLTSNVTESFSIICSGLDDSGKEVESYKKDYKNIFVQIGQKISFNNIVLGFVNKEVKSFSCKKVKGS